MPIGWGRPSEAGVIVVDDDASWQRAIRRALRDLDVRRVYSASAQDDLEALIVDLEPCVILTELELGGARLAGLDILDKAHAFATPAALVAGCSATRLDPIRQAQFARKTQLGRGALRDLLRRLEAGLPASSVLLPRER